MKRIVFLLLTVLFGFGFLNVSAQNTLTVHDGTTTNSYVPIYGFYADAYLKADFIFPASELTDMSGASITNMKFYATQSSVSWGANFQVHLKEVDESTITNAFMVGPGSTIVYNGVLSIENGVMEVTFNQPFSYNGGNLLVGFWGDEPGDYVTSTWLGETVSNSSFQGYSYTSLVAISGSQRNFLPKTTFTFVDPASSCFAPSSPTISDVSSNTATLSWTPGDGQNAWEVCCDSGTVDLSQATWIPISTDTFYTFTGLIPNTSYTAYIRTVCGTETSGVRESSFWTASIPVNMPFICNFENDSLNNKWSFRNEDQTNQWFIGGAVNNTPGGNKSLYISNDNGLSNTYTLNSQSSVWAFFDIDFADANEFRLKFDYKVMGESGFSYALSDQLRVYIGTPDNVSAGSSDINNATMLGNYRLQNTWQTDSITLPASYANTTKRVYFLWHNDNLEGQNPPAAIDNLSLIAVECARPANLIISDITTSSVSVNIVPASSSDSQWQILCTEGDSTIAIVSTTSTTNVYVDNLNLAATYTLYARTICDGGDTSIWSLPISFNTACELIDTLPYIWDFETNNIGGTSDFPLPACWDRAGNENDPYVGDYNGHLAYQCLNSGYNPSNTIAVLPQINTAVLPINTLHLTFYAKYAAYYGISDGRIEVGAMSNPADTNSFTTIYTIDVNNGLSGSYNEFMVPLNSYTGNASYIALRFNGTGNMGYSASIYVDDITLEPMPSCPRPESIAADSINDHEATISWTSNENLFNVYYKTTEASDYTLANSNPVSGTSYTLTGLTPNTTYAVYVAAVCGDQSETPSRPISFHTQCTAFIVTPTSTFFEDFSTLTSGIPACWDNSDGTTTDETYKWNYYDEEENNVCVRFNSFNNAIYLTSMLKTPILNLTALTTPQLSFKFKNPEGGDLSVFLSTDGGATYTTAIATGLTDVSEWTEVEYELPGNGDNVVIVFQGTSNYGYGDAYIYLDDIKIEETPTCLKPNNFAVSNYGDTEVSLSWHEANEATHWNVAYGPSPLMIDSNATIIPATDTTLTIFGLTTGQSYDFYVQADCGDMTSPWKGPLTIIPGAFIFGVNGNSAITACDIVLYDNGGPNGDYSPHCDYTLTVYPTDPDSVVSISGTLNVENSYDKLYIYEGTSTSGTTLATLTGDAGSFGPYTSEIGPITLRFTSDYSNQNDGFEISVSCVAANNCRHPYDLSATPSATGAAISWMADDGANIELYYKEHSSNVYTVVSASEITGNSYVITNLSPSTAYEVYVANICVDDTLVSDVIVFSTHCVTISSYPYIENFSITSPFLECWTVNNANNDNSTFTYDNSNGYMYYVWHASNAADDWLISPFFLLNGGQIADFDYWSHPIFEEKFQVFAMTNETSFALTPVISIQSDAVQNITIDLSELTGEYQIGIHCISNRDKFNLYIDNFRVRNAEIPEITVEPSYMHFHSDLGVTTNPKIAVVSGMALSDNITASTIAPFEVSTDGTHYSTSVTIAASAQTTNANLYVRYTPTVTGTQIGAVNLTSGTVTATITLNGRAADCSNVSLPYSEVFDSYNDGITADFNTPAGYPDVDMPLCWSFPNRSNSATEFPQVFISYSTLYSIAGNCLFLRSSRTTPAYAVLPSFQQDIHNLKLSFYYRNEGIGIDNGVLSVGYMTDPSDATTFTELASMAQVSSLTLDSVLFNTVPASVTNANIAFKYTGGMFDDFFLSIDNVLVETIGAPIPVNPSVATVAATNIEQNTATLNATITNPDNVTITAKGFEWKPASGGNFTQIAGTGSGNTFTATLANLTANTTYTYKAFISFNNETVYGAEMSFTTEEQQDSCNAPINPIISNISHNSADISWTAGGSETAWNLQYKLASAPNWSNFIPLTTNSYHFSNLNPETTYQVRAQAVCSDSEISGWSTVVSFTTTAEQGNTCNAPTNLQVDNITSNTATMSWNAGGDEVLWKVGYKLATENQWQEATVATTSYNLESLTPESNYEVRVKAICTSSSESDFVSNSFSTLPVGINNLTLANSISLMPNPADNYIELSVSGNAEVKEATIFNAFGQLIQTIQLTDNHARIDLSNMASGMYFVRINGNNVTATKKFIRK